MRGAGLVIGRDAFWDLQLHPTAVDGGRAPTERKLGLVKDYPSRCGPNRLYGLLRVADGPA